MTCPIDPLFQLDLRLAVDGDRVTDEALSACSQDLGAAMCRLMGLPRGAGFLELDPDAWALTECKRVAEQLASHASCLLVLGIGGSALGAVALRDALPGRIAAGRRLEVLDSVDPDSVRRCMAGLDPQDTALAVVSKSGATAESLALLRVFIPWLREVHGDAWKQRVVAITDADSGSLRTFASQEALAALPIPGGVGGRFSVLTAVGLLPAAFLGLDCDELLRGAAEQRQQALHEAYEDNLAWRVAALHHLWRDQLTNTVWLSYCDRLQALGMWFRQLVAESLGKVGEQGRRRGWTALVARGAADQHSQLQLWRDGPRRELFTVLSAGDDAEAAALTLGAIDKLPGAWLGDQSLSALQEASRRGMMATLVDTGAPVLGLHVENLTEASVGALIVFWETVVALVGLLEGIDPFSQPAVEDAKRFTAGMLGREDCRDDAQRALALLALDRK
ncbi:MAG: glucose-6-phosphate isomerase [Rickettsiales bacterium]|nr:glucose-6-phosphate isomerase [Rickettsiales bacterium]